VLDGRDDGSIRVAMSGGVIAVADDLTGALEVGAQFAARGWSAIVSTRAGATATGGSTVLVLDTETRHLCPESAAEVVRRHTLPVALGWPSRFFKKTDSTLRGNIGSELEAIAGLFSGASIVYVPAYPQFGRTVLDGVLYVNGKPLHKTEFACDQLNPAVRSSILEMLAAQTRMTVRSVAPRDLKTPSTPCILVCDGVCDEDIAMAAQFISGNDMLIGAGPSALAKELATLWPPPIDVRDTLPSISRCLVVNGSLHPRSVAHCREARDSGVPVVTALRAKSGDWALLDTETEVTGAGTSRSEEIGKLVRQALESSDFDAILAFGGDTAYGIVKALGEPPLFSIGNAAPGVPISRIRAADLYPQWGRARDLYFLSKAGGFGDDGLVLRLKERLQILRQGILQ
jgi:uncharacterized protein YgbK (DUF1537 family)